jgi:hypothetical protein
MTGAFAESRNRSYSEEDVCAEDIRELTKESGGAAQITKALINKRAFVLTYFVDSGDAFGPIMYDFGLRTITEAQERDAEIDRYWITMDTDKEIADNGALFLVITERDALGRYLKQSLEVAATDRFDREFPQRTTRWAGVVLGPDTNGRCVMHAADSMLFWDEVPKGMRRFIREPATAGWRHGW